MNVKMKVKMIGAALALSWGVAQAGIIQVGGSSAGADGKISNRTGVCTITFNGGNAANSCGALYSADAAGTQPLAASHFPIGSQAGEYATPAGDSTRYLTVGPTDGPVVFVRLTNAANYFGFYAGSLDMFNLVEFFMGSTLVDSFSGDQINAVAFPGDPTNGNQAQAQFIDYFPGRFVNGIFVPALFTSVRFASSSDAFETDNHAFGVASPDVVPEPGSIALFGLGALAVFASRRRKAQKT
jgi:PEP-CTERM motif